MVFTPRKRSVCFAFQLFICLSSHEEPRGGSMMMYGPTSTTSLWTVLASPPASLALNARSYSAGNRRSRSALLRLYPELECHLEAHTPVVKYYHWIIPLGFLSKNCWKQTIELSSDLGESQRPCEHPALSASASRGRDLRPTWKAE